MRSSSVRETDDCRAEATALQDSSVSLQSASLRRVRGIEKESGTWHGNMTKINIVQKLRMTQTLTFQPSNKEQN